MTPSSSLSSSPARTARWLQTNPSLGELQSAWPREWDTVQQQLLAVLATRDQQQLRAYVQRVSRPGPPRPELARHKAGQDAHLRARVRSHMAAAALKQLCTAAATGVSDRPLRFNLLNGWIAQRLLFSDDLQRKPASHRIFNALWPVLRQRDYLMPLVQPQGIYCFYSKALVRELAAVIDGRRALEIAAGDGTLSRFVRQAGSDIIATDDFSWPQATQRAVDVHRQAAAKALAARRPEVVVCSWPPAGNPFERHVFTTPSVHTYIVIASRHRFAAGDWAAYESQRAFTMSTRPDLAKLVLPPELESQVYIFERAAA